MARYSQLQHLPVNDATFNLGHELVMVDCVEAGLDVSIEYLYHPSACE